MEILLGFLKYGMFGIGVTCQIYYLFKLIKITMQEKSGVGVLFLYANLTWLIPATFIHSGEIDLLFGYYTLTGTMISVLTMYNFFRDKLLENQLSL